MIIYKTYLRNNLSSSIVDGNPDFFALTHHSMVEFHVHCAHFPSLSHMYNWMISVFEFQWVSSLV